MADLTLGLDIGCSSVGWALIDETAETIIALGVRVFPEGVERDQQGGEKSKSQGRRDARGMRRQLARRARRRRALRDALARVGLLPKDPSAIRALMCKDPYELRRKAITERLELYDLGRALFHLAQRRGYLSNRKTDSAKANDQKGILAEMGELAARLDESRRTLGQYLADVRDDAGTCENSDGARIRNRHTRRDMFEREFEAIWEAQRQHHPELLNGVLKYGTSGKQSYPRATDPGRHCTDILSEYGVHGLVFFQRKMYPPKSVIGRCELERREKRCPRAARIAQRFRILQEVNNLRVLDYSVHEKRPLTTDERSVLLDYLANAKERRFDEIRKKLGLAESTRFNLELGGRKKLDGHRTDAALSGKNGIGKGWLKLPDAAKDAIVDILIDDDPDDVTLQQLINRCGLSADEAQRAMCVPLADGRMNYSRLAMTKLVPHLERGLVLMAEDAANSALHAAGYLRPDERAANQRRFLPYPPAITNPIVRQAVTEVRKVVNAILREYVYRAGHRLKDIRVELAREAKKSFEERKELRFENARRRRDREDAAAAIEEYDAAIKPSRATVNRYLLWQEQDESCVYCGQKISMAQLFNGDADIDHILPRWRSLDDSMANKVLCHRACNRDKGDRTPREWLEHNEPDRYQLVLQCAGKLPYNKQWKFQQEDIELKDFVARQLNDTAYISRAVSQYLRCLGARILCPRGQMTSELCHWWGLNNILDPTKTDKKNRDDHRQHAVDALTLALTNDKRLHALANSRGKDMPLPWLGFREQAETLVLAINVSHRALRKVRGPLHKESFYGATEKADVARGDAGSPRPWAKNWVEDPSTFVRRKPVADLKNTRDLVDVRDATIREILRQHLRDRGVDPDTPCKIPTDTLKGVNVPRMPSGVPIRKVRMLEHGTTFRVLSRMRSYQFVLPESNHHIVYRALGVGDAESWNATVVIMWDAADRASHVPLVDHSDTDMGQFLFSLSIGEMFEIDGGDGGRSLCVVRKMRQDNKRLHYKSHTDARKADEIEKENLYLSPRRMQQLHARKVAVDAVGRVRRADSRFWNSESHEDS